MITFFNRAELIYTHSMNDQREITHDLNEAGIDYRLEVENRQTRARIFTGGRQSAIDGYLYTFYVHQKDLERAQAALSRNYEK